MCRADQDEAAAALLDGLTLDTLLEALHRGRGYDPALRDPPGRRGWSDVGPVSLTFAQLESRVDQLARLLTINQAQAGATVALLAPLGPEAITAILGCLRAGLSPLMLPLHANELDLLRLIETTGAVMALGVGKIGSERPLLTLRNLAVRAFSTRFVGGFGSDIPDGVAPLETMLASAALQALPTIEERAAIQVVDPLAIDTVMRLEERQLLATALDISRLLKPMENSRIVSAMIGGDLASLAAGPAMALLTGVEFLPLGLFSLGDLQACMEGGRHVHLVLPGTMEPAIAQSKLAAHKALASLVFVHRPSETRTLPAIDRPDIAIVDVDVKNAAELLASRR